MKSKITLTIFLAFIFSMKGFAQLKQGDTTYTYRTIVPQDKQNRLKNVDFIANMQYGLRNDWSNGDYLGSKFRMEQFRLEIRGWVTDNIYFRFRHRFTSGFEPQSVDKIIKGVDFAYITAKFNDKWRLTLGKTYADWGGYEFDLNPIDVYEYSDIIEEADNFLSGIGLSYQASPNHQFGLQALNPRNRTFDEIYQADTILTNTTVEASKTPIAGVFTWRGSFFSGKFTTLWHYSVFKEAKDNFKNYMAFGNMLNLDKVSIAYDYKLSLEDIDRTGIITRVINQSPTFSGDPSTFVFTNTRYQSHWLNITYRFVPKWQLNVSAFVDQAATEEPGGNSFVKIRTAYGLTPTLEYFPWDDTNLKFFAGYVGRTFNYTDKIKSAVALSDDERARVIFGFVAPLKFL
ncbi:MAG: hypothetical protein JXR03_18170 [Cyclobacteriaceae bacterium]